MSVFHSYRRLFSLPGFSSSLFSALSGKLQPGIFSLSLLLAVAHYRSLHVASVVLAAYSIGSTTVPLRGRLMDRYGYKWVMLPALVCYLGSLVGLVTNEAASGPLGVTLACAVAASVTAPPVSVVTRLMWRAMAEGDLRTTALSLDAVLTDVGFVVGPVAAVFLVQYAAPWAGLAASAALTSSATVLLVLSGRLPRQQPRETAERDWLGPLRLGSLRRVLMAAALFFLSVQAIELAFPAWATSHNLPLMTGILLSSMSVGSVVGGVALGALPPKWSGRARFPVTLAALTLGTVVVTAASQTAAWILVPAAALLGLALGPTFVALYGSVGDLAPERMAAEAQSWVASFMYIGSSLGSLASGAVLERYSASGVLVLAALGFASASMLARTPAATGAVADKTYSTT